jgi:hypothetical protein
MIFAPRPACPWNRTPAVRQTRRVALIGIKAVVRSFHQGSAMRFLILPLLMLSLPAARAAEPFRDGPPQSLRAELKTDRLVILVAGRPFTEYLCETNGKYPYFFPVLGPRTSRSVTTRRETNFPHHSSIFFGCDRVNGGNYWQEANSRGRIVSKDVRLLRAEGEEIVFEQDCSWERPGAASPFSDQRRIAVRAPSPDLRVIDFEVSLTARNKVRIDKTNHSLFSARMAPDLSVLGGGVLVNALGDRAERGTFGKKAGWMDARGKRGGETEGLVMLTHPANRWNPPPWFTRDYGFLSPTPLNWLEGGFTEMAAGEVLRLRYRVVIHGGDPSTNRWDTELAAFAK